MPSRQTEYARRTKAELIAKLGGKCEHCAESDPDKLQFDHINGRHYEPHRLSYSARLARYKKEAAKGELRLLCEPCNLAARNTNDNGQFVPTAATIEKTVEIPLDDNGNPNW